jgi:hypothetical protein
MSKRRNKREQVYQAQLFVQRRGWQLLPPHGSPASEAMRPNSPYDPTIESMEECSDRFIVGVTPIDYGPGLLLMPFGFHLAVDTLPSGACK